VTALRRLVAVGSIATLLDVTLLVVLSQVVGWAPGFANAVAIAIATLFSGLGHRRVGLGADPSRRWYRNVPQYLGASVAALAVDVGLLVLLTGGRRDVATTHLLAAKAVSLTAAFLVRVVFFRESMFATVRSEQGHRRDRPPPPGAVRLSLVVPAYEESEGIADTIARIEAALGHLRSDGGFELVVVDDGSVDDTAEQAERAGADVVVRQHPNQGKGAAVRAGVRAASGRTVAFTDADLSYSPDQVLRLLDAVESGWDVVVGSRRHTETRTLVANGRLREVGGRVINLLTSIVLLGQYRDTQCGLKAFRSDVASLLFSRARIDGFAFDVELFHLVERYRLSLLEVPVEVANSTRSTVRVARDATRLVRDLFRIRAIGRGGGYELSVADLPPTLAEPARRWSDLHETPGPPG
jgi:putative flippase GtrA